MGKSDHQIEGSVAPDLDEGVVERTKPGSFELRSESEEKEIRTKGLQPLKFQVELCRSSLVSYRYSPS